MIDAHVHINDFEAARRALISGVTTARSMGVSHFVDVGMRKLAAAGKIDSPEILSAGYHVRPRPADALFIDMPELAGLMRSGVRGPDAMREMGRAMLSRGVNWIKTNATARAGLPNTDPREPYYSEAELAALVEEGAKSSIPVAAHAHGDEGGRAAVMAGVRSIEHGTYLSKETLSIMVEKGTYLVPTIAVVSDLTRPGGDYDNPVLEVRGRHMLPRIRETAALAHKLGVKIVAATDTGYGPNSTLRMSQELEELVHVGLSPLQAIQSATVVAAELVGVADHTGKIAAGFDADLIVVERNPLENIGAIHDLLMVVNNGKIVLNRASW
ncbi:MAG: amidohydrolase family protein [Blastocatellia bacterium]|nr:amidohydrolase family protein [Blastocatellia bacterium]